MPNEVSATIIINMSYHIFGTTQSPAMVLQTLHSDTVPIDLLLTLYTINTAQIAPSICRRYMNNVAAPVSFAVAHVESFILKLVPMVCFIV